MKARKPLRMAGYIVTHPLSSVGLAASEGAIATINRAFIKENLARRI